ncbi:MAG: phosphotransferase [Candidatus Moranbacteria bacterium]|nr:phosphotransferase [Candidatus Moranbacteria bacterium]
MAIDREFLRMLSERYRFSGELRFVEKVKQGYLSHNFILEDSEKKYFLKQYRFDDAYRVTEVQEAKKFFHERDIPVVMPILSLDGSSFFVHDHTFYTLFPYVTGYQFGHTRLSENALRSAGEMLAKIHTLGKNKCPLSIDPRSFAWNHDDFMLRADALKTIIHTQSQQTEYDTSALQCLDMKADLIGHNTKRYEDFSLLQDDAHILHGDFHDENLFFDEYGKVIAVFDWEKVNCGPRGMDVARSLLLICFWDGFEESHFHDASVYLKAYCLTYPLTKEYLKEAIMAWNMVQMHSLWVLEGHYLRHDTRMDDLLVSHMRGIRYFAANEDAYIKRLTGSLPS